MHAIFVDVLHLPGIERFGRGGHAQDGRAVSGNEQSPQAPMVPTLPLTDLARNLAFQSGQLWILLDGRGAMSYIIHRPERLLRQLRTAIMMGNRRVSGTTGS
jgi:hypothetical protein